MPYRARRANDGLEAFSEVTATMMAAVEHDLNTNPESTLDIQKDLTDINERVPVQILSNARSEAQAGTDTETAYVKGAYYILGLLDRPVKVGLLRAIFEIESSEETTEELPAA